MSAAILRHPLVWAAVAAAALLLLVGSIGVVPETAEGVLLRMGEPVAVLNRAAPGGRGTGAGPVLHWPVVEELVLVDRRARAIELNDAELQSADRMRLVADIALRFRVADPVLMLRRLGGEGQLINTLGPLTVAAMRAEAAARPAATLYGADDSAFTGAVLARVAPAAAKVGAAVLSLRLERADLPTGQPLDAAIERMRSARQGQAQQIAAAGETEAAAIRTEADADAARIYAASYGQDPDFYDFYRAMQSYRRTLTPGTAIVLSRGSDYLRQFGASAR